RGGCGGAASSCVRVAAVSPGVWCRDGSESGCWGRVAGAWLLVAGGWLLGVGIRGQGQGMRLMNAHTRTVVASAVEVADDRATRRKGLLGRDHLDPAAALVPTPCFSVHTAFMKFT